MTTTLYHEAPDDFLPPGVFLGGGISGCHDWQAEVAGAQVARGLHVFNPRRANFDVDDPAQGPAQIRWEYRYLRRADALLFWFPPETPCPITLFELGAHLMVAGKPIFVGTHPDYPRRADVVIQAGIIRPDIQVVQTLADLVAQVVAWQARERAAP